jgi:hypothetical protein
MRDGDQQQPLRSKNRVTHKRFSAWSESHTRRRECLLNGFLDLVKDDKAGGCNHDCGCAGE